MWKDHAAMDYPYCKPHLIRAFRMDQEVRAVESLDRLIWAFCSGRSARLWPPYMGSDARGGATNPVKRLDPPLTPR